MRMLHLLGVVRGQRPYSIRTRIKTSCCNCSGSGCCVRDHIPLEQGLRHNGAMGTALKGNVRDHIPLEQGLRLMTYDPT